MTKLRYCVSSVRERMPMPGYETRPPGKCCSRSRVYEARLHEDVRRVGGTPARSRCSSVCDARSCDSIRLITLANSSSEVARAAPLKCSVLELRPSLAHAAVDRRSGRARSARPPRIVATPAKADELASSLLGAQWPRGRCGNRACSHRAAGTKWRAWQRSIDYIPHYKSLPGEKFPLSAPGEAGVFQPVKVRWG